MLCPSANGGKREYKGALGKADNRIINIMFKPIDNDQCINIKPEVEIMEDIVGCEKQEDPSVINQNVNNPFVFNFNQYGNNTTQIGHIENYYADKEKKQNE